MLILSGGNIDINQLARIIERGLVKSHRRMRLRTVIPDLPGALTELIQIIAQSQANIVEIYHNRLALDVLLNDTEVVLNVEIRDQAHASQVLAALKRLAINQCSFREIKYSGHTHAESSDHIMYSRDFAVHL